MGMADIRYPGGGAAFELPGYDVEIVPLDHADSKYYYLKADFQKWKGRQFVFLVMTTLIDTSPTPIHVVATKMSTFLVNTAGTTVSMSTSNDSDYPGGASQYVPFVPTGTYLYYEHFNGAVLQYDITNDYIYFNKKSGHIDGTPVSCVGLRISKT